MPSAISYSKERHPKGWFSPTLFRKNLTRFWPIWALYGAVWFLILTIGTLNSRGLGQHGPAETMDRFYPTGFVVKTIPMGVYISLIFGVLAAMAVFSYLYNSRPAGLMHALPIRREGLFLTNYLSGLCFFLIPIAGVVLLTLFAQVYAGYGVDFTSLFLWAWCQALMSLFFYSFAVFCAMFTGHILALPAFYGILNGLAAALYYLFAQMASQFLFGYVSSQSGTLSDLISWLTPVLRYSRTLGNTGSPDYRFTGLLSIFIYGLAGLLLTALALLVYRRRHIESAGDVVSVSWVRPIFKYGVAFCSAVSLGTFLWTIFLSDAYAQSSIWSLLLFMLFAGILGYFVAEMLLQKTFRVFRRNWKGCVGFSLVLLLAASTMEFDLGGYEQRLPSTEQVAQVHVECYNFAPHDDGSYIDAPLSDATSIAKVTALHNAILQNQHAIESNQNGGTWNTVVVDSARLEVEESGTSFIHFTYLLKDGGTLERQYSIPISRELLNDSTSPAAMLDELINAPGMAQRDYFRNYREGDTLISAHLSTIDGDEQFIRGDALETLYAAVQSDLSAGRLGHRYLLEDAERFQTCYYNDLTLIFSPSPQRRDPMASNKDDLSYSITITLQTTASDTRKVLENLGMSELLVVKYQTLIDEELTNERS